MADKGWFEVLGVPAVTAAVVGAIVSGVFGWVQSERIESLRAIQSERIESLRAIQSEKIETLRKDLDAKRLVHKVQFEKEFKIYEELWAAIVELRATVITPERPSVKMREQVMLGSFKKDGETWRVIVPAKGDFADAYSNLKRIYRNGRPFYDGAIYSTVKRLTDVALNEEFWQTFRVPGEDHSGDVVGNAEELAEKMDEVCEAIRKRIGTMNVE